MAGCVLLTCNATRHAETTSRLHHFGMGSAYTTRNLQQIIFCFVIARHIMIQILYKKLFQTQTYGQHTSLKLSIKKSFAVLFMQRFANNRVRETNVELRLSKSLLQLCDWKLRRERGGEGEGRGKGKRKGEKERERAESSRRRVFDT